MKTKFVCIDNDQVEDFLTIGKIYEGEGTRCGKFIQVICDSNNEHSILSKRFIPLSQYRKEKISNILNNI